MGENSKIEWTDHTFNPWEGCTKVSPGCANCYAEARNHRYGLDNWGSGKPRRRTSEANWRKPLQWNKTGICATCGTTFLDGGCHDRSTLRRPRVFCASLADWLDDEVPIKWLADLLKLIHLTPNLDWLMLTKRPENWLERVTEAWRHINCDYARKHPAFFVESWIGGKAPDNVWIGATAENQEYADRRIPDLIKIPAKVRFLSCEPLLGAIDIEEHLDDLSAIESAPIHWVISGGESGPGARPSHPEWHRSLRDQCVWAGVPFLFKQWGEWLHGAQASDDQLQALGRCNIASRWSNGTTSWRVGKKSAGRLLDGRTWDEFPLTQPKHTNS